MANQAYVKGRQKFLEGSIAYLSDNIKVVLVDVSSYTINASTDEFLSDITSGARVATSGNLASKTSTGGTANAANITFSAVTGAQCSLIVLYKDTGTASTSPLFLALDTAVNLPVTPNGGDITVQWDTGSNKIFTLRQAIKLRWKRGKHLWEPGLAGENAFAQLDSLWFSNFLRPPTLVNG